ncbi:MAG: lysophospholipid acyltransferase family protein [Clostridium sp.]|nr:lysophospholipid acyltransferase family protein [Clostridium sp.]
MIIPTRLAKVIEKCPDGVAKFVSKRFLRHLVKKYAKIHLSGAENLNNIDSSIIFICNHLSNSDGLVLNEVLKKWDPTFVAGVKLSGDAVTRLGTVAVKNTPIIPNSPDMAGITRVVKLLKNGENIVIFPEGTRSREGSLIKAKPGLTLFANRANVKIVPIGMYGTENLLPISEDGNMSGETFHEADVYIKIGKPFKIEKRSKEEGRKEYENKATDFAMSKIAEILPEEYRGIYK